MSRSTSTLKPLFFCAVLLADISRAEELRDPKAILKELHLPLTDTDRVFSGRLRTGSDSLPFTLMIKNGVTQIDFAPPGDSLLLRPVGKVVRVQRIKAGATESITGARLNESIQGSMLTYEDLTVPFLQWTDVTMEGDQFLVLRKCWVIRANAPPKSNSRYARVRLWVTKDESALFQVEFLTRDDKLLRRIKLISLQGGDPGRLLLKLVRIESFEPEVNPDRRKTYLEVDRPK